MFDTGQTLLAACARDADAPALADADRFLSYGELTDTAARLAGLFDDMGLRAGDRLLVAMQNRMETALVYWATQLAGIVFTPVNWRVKSGELDYFLNDSRASALVYCPVAAEAVGSSALAGALPQIAVGADDTFLKSVLAHPAPEDLPRASASMLSVLLYTSGTTGPGKGVPRTHHAERSAALAHVAQNAYMSGETTLGIMPLYHTMGVRSLLAMTLVNGLFACQHKFSASDSLALIERHRVSALYLVPTLYHDLLAHAEFEKTDISSVRKLGFAGAPMTDDLLKRTATAFRPELFVNHYGSSEIYTFTVNQKAAAKPGSAGRAGINSIVKLIALDAETVEGEVGPGEPGHIIARLSSDEAFSGYWHRPDADVKALKDGWYLTGDVGYLDADGDLFVTGRMDDMIISGGENILPSEIESVLSLHPDVSEVAVAGLPDDRLGQRVTAFVKPLAPVTDEALDAWCRRSDLADFKRPREYVFIEELPKSPVGKVLRRVLAPR